MELIKTQRKENNNTGLGAIGTKHTGTYVGQHMVRDKSKESLQITWHHQTIIDTQKATVKKN